MRKTARENAFKLTFEQLIGGARNELTYNALTSGLNEEDKLYLDTLLDGVTSEKAFLTKTIASFARGFTAERIYKIDLAILLIATYEILFLSDVPDKVSVNEAVELAKTYSTDNSPSFINGVLASVIKEKENLLNERNED